MKSLKFWTPIAVSLIVTPFARLAGIASTGAGHGDYFWTKILFPYTMLSASVFDSITVPFIALAFVQFPLYGLFLAFAGVRGETVGAAALTLVHVLAASLCLTVADGNFS